MIQKWIAFFYRFVICWKVNVPIKLVQVENYSLMTSRIYHQLFQPVINKKKIIVIPDGALNLIPVEALVVNHQPEKLTFKNLDYLIYDHEITYAYSSSILFHKTMDNTNEIKNVLAFSYSDDSGEANIYRQNQLPELPGTYKELETLSRIFKKVMGFSDRDALKTNFINHAKDHDLIHLEFMESGIPRWWIIHVLFLGETPWNRETYTPMTFII